MSSSAGLGPRWVFLVCFLYIQALGSWLEKEQKGGQGDEIGEWRPPRDVQDFRVCT
jgi:hypothetical protein